MELPPHKLELVHTTKPSDVSTIFWISDTELGYTSDRKLYRTSPSDWTCPAVTVEFPEGVEASSIQASGDWVYFSGQIWKQDGDFEKVPEHEKEHKERKNSARVFDALPVRIWDTWMTPGKVWTVGKVSLKERSFVNLLDAEIVRPP